MIKFMQTNKIIYNEKNKFLKQTNKKKLSKLTQEGEFPGIPVVRTQHFHHRGPEFHPWLGNTRKPHSVAKTIQQNK